MLVKFWELVNYPRFDEFVCNFSSIYVTSFITTLHLKYSQHNLEGNTKKNSPITMAARTWTSAIMLQLLHCCHRASGLPAAHCRKEYTPPRSHLQTVHRSCTACRRHCARPLHYSAAGRGAVAGITPLWSGDPRRTRLLSSRIMQWLHAVVVARSIWPAAAVRWTVVAGLCRPAHCEALEARRTAPPDGRFSSVLAADWFRTDRPPQVIAQDRHRIT